MPQFPLQQGDRLTDHVNCDIVVERVSSGFFGMVAMGPCSIKGRWAALKTLKPHLLAYDDVRERFIREALTWVGIWPHPNVLRASTVIEIDRVPFLMLAYAPGGNLQERLQTTQPLEARLQWAQQIAAGLLYLHTPDPAYLRPHGLVHGDLKPDNILLMADHRAVLSDFGLVKAVGISGGMRPGPCAFMAPEQWLDPTSIGTAADLYAFGLVLSELFAGRHALLDDSPAPSTEDWKQAHLSRSPRALRDVVPDLPASVEALYLACLAKRPEDRPTTRQALRNLQKAADALEMPVYTVQPNRTPQTVENEGEFWHDWSIAYDTFGFYPEALERSDRALALEPQHPLPLHTRGNILRKLGRPEEAIAAWRASLAVLPVQDTKRRGLVLNSLANLYHDGGNYHQAEIALAESCTLSPQNGIFWYNRAKNQGMWGAAELQARHCSEAYTHWQQARNHSNMALGLEASNGTFLELHVKIQQGLELCQTLMHLGGTLEDI